MTTATSFHLNTVDAHALLLTGQAPEDMRVYDRLNLQDTDITHLPRGLKAHSVDVSGCHQLEALPEHLEASRINASGCPKLQGVPASIKARELNLRGTAITSLPPGLRVSRRLDLRDCRELTSLPEKLASREIILAGCTKLRSLPAQLSCTELNLADCTNLEDWPEGGTLIAGTVNASGCARLKRIPGTLQGCTHVNIHGCASLTELGEGLSGVETIEMGGAGLTELPASLKGVQLLLGGLPVSHQVALQAGSITAADIFNQRNAEVRRVMLSQFGLDRFFATVGGDLLDIDRDAGGLRRLLRVRLPDDEDLVCVSVVCPSTGHQHLLRVPPEIRTCHQAIAWTFGFENPQQYQPLIEA